MIDAADISRARSVPIADEIHRRGIKLRRAGQDLVGACPVCGDGGKGNRSDRFAVHPRKNTWLCGPLIRSGWRPPQWWFDFTKLLAERRALLELRLNETPELVSYPGPVGVASRFEDSDISVIRGEGNGEGDAYATLRLQAKLRRDFPEREVKMANVDNELQRRAEDDSAVFIRTAGGTWRADDKDGIVIVRDAMSIAEAARLYCEDQELVLSTPSAVLTRIVKEYAPYDAMPEFRVGFESHARGFYGNPYDPDSVAAQAWDRGLETASRYARTASTNRHELDAAVAGLSAETGTPYTPPADGEMVAGVYRDSLALASGRATVIDTGVGLALVPWTPDLERQRGRHVSGIAQPGGGVEWRFERKRGLEI